jgi:hypothetical protein
MTLEQAENRAAFAELLPTLLLQTSCSECFSLLQVASESIVERGLAFQQQTEANAA